MVKLLVYEAIYPKDGRDAFNSLQSEEGYNERLQNLKTEVLKQTGGKSEPWLDEQWWSNRQRQASVYYDYVRSQDDFKKIASASGMSVVDIQHIKQHIFFNKHIMYDGSIKRAASDYDIAVVWQLLSNGKPLPRDIILLKHELLEYNIETRTPGITFSQAHGLASKEYDWADLLMKEMGMGEDDGILPVKKPKRK